MEDTITLDALDSMGIRYASVTLRKEIRENPITDEKDTWYLITGGYGYDFGTLIALRELPIGSCQGIVLPQHRMETPTWKVAR